MNRSSVRFRSNARPYHDLYDHVNRSFLIAIRFFGIMIEFIAKARRRLTAEQNDRARRRAESCDAEERRQARIKAALSMTEQEA